jgi:lipoate-protein ligase B
MSINIDTPENRVEKLECCGIEAGMHTSLSQLGYVNDNEGLLLDVDRMEKSLILTCEENLGRVPIGPVDWSPEVLV